MTLLGGCATKPVIKYMPPPQVYLIPCSQTEFSGSTYGEAIIYLRKVIDERDICASRLKGVIDWSKQYGLVLDEKEIN